jgi:hypothetical protein
LLANNPNQMTRNQIGDLPNFFDRYILLTAESQSLLEALEEFSPKKVFSDIEKYKSIGDLIYAPNKWILKDILQHCIDTERIMSYRALCFARNDDTILPGFEEGLYAKNTNLNKRSMESLIEEFAVLRQSTILLFKNMNKTMLLRKGTANMTRISPLSLGFVIVGHAKHHQNIIRERYYALA